MWTMQRDSCYRCLPPSVPVRTSCFAEKTATKNKRGEKDSGRRHPALHRQGLRILQTNRVPMLRMTPTMWTKRQKFQTDLGRHNGHASIFSADVRGRVRRHLRTSRGDDQRGHGNTLCLPSVSLSLSLLFPFQLWLFLHLSFSLNNAYNQKTSRLKAWCCYIHLHVLVPSKVPHPNRQT